MKYKILIIDLDDTLIDNKENVRAAFKKMVSEQNEKYSDDNFQRWYEIDKKFWIDWQDGLIEVPDDLKREKGKKSDRFLDWVRSQRMLRYFNDALSAERAVELNNVYMEGLKEVVVAIDDAKSVMKYLSERYKTIVATNGPRVATRQKLEQINCLQFTTEVLSADMFGYMKPKVEFFKAIEKRYDDHDRGDYLIIGDSLKSDVGFGMNAEIDSCWFNHNNEAADKFYKPTYVITKLDELKTLL